MAARLVSSGIGVPWLLVAAAPCGGVRILSDRPVPVSSSQVAPTTSIPMPSPGSATTVFIYSSLTSTAWPLAALLATASVNSM